MNNFFLLFNNRHFKSKRNYETIQYCLSCFVPIYLKLFRRPHKFSRHELKNCFSCFIPTYFKLFRRPHKFYRHEFENPTCNKETLTNSFISLILSLFFILSFTHSNNKIATLPWASTLLRQNEFLLFNTLVFQLPFPLSHAPKHKYHLINMLYSSYKYFS